MRRHSTWPEAALLEAGDIDGFVELNASTWLGPEADAGTRELVRIMQRRAAEVQLAAESGAGHLPSLERPEAVTALDSRLLPLISRR
jgi:hypothetical protein